MFRVKLTPFKILICMLLLCFAFFIMLPHSPVKAAQFACPPNCLRIVLAQNLPSSQFSISEGKYDLVDYITQRVISSAAGTGKWVVAPKGSANIQVSYNGSPVPGPVGSLLVLRQTNPAGLNVFSFSNKRYRGDLLIENRNGKLDLINVIDVEQYLCGVVGAEMGMGAHDEAYKAQAVVSRTYAYYHKQHPQLNYDLGIPRSGRYTADMTPSWSAAKE